MKRIIYFFKGIWNGYVFDLYHRKEYYGLDFIESKIYNKLRQKELRE